MRQHVVGILGSIIIGAGVGVGGFFLLNLVYPLYSSEVLFEVKPGISESTEIGTATSLSDQEVERMARTQTELIRQRDILNRAVNTPDVRDTDWIRIWYMDPETNTPRIELAVDELEEDLRTPVLRGTNLFAIRWSAHHPHDVTRVLDAVARAFMSTRRELDNAIFDQNESLFETQANRLREQIDAFNDEIQAFIRAQGITTLDDPRFSQAAIEVENLAKSLTEASQQVASVQSSYMQTAAKLEGTMKPSSEDILEAENDAALVQQLQRLEVLKSEERSVREQFNEGTPQVRNIERRVRSVEQQIKQKTDEVLRRNLNARLRTLDSERERMQGVIDGLEEELTSKDAALRDLTAHSAYYESLQQQRDNLEEQRNATQKLLREISLMKLRSDASRVTQYGTADLPREPSFPRLEYVVPAGVVLVTGLFVGIVFLREVSNKKIRSMSDLAIVPGVRPLGGVPDIDDDPREPEEAECVVLDEPNSVTAESLRQIGRRILRSMQDQGHQSLVLTGGLPGAGTTTLISNIAIGGQAAGHSVCVLDANFRRSRLGEVLGVDAGPGLGEVLGGSATVDDVVVKGRGDVDVIQAGEPAQRVIERLTGEAMGALLATLRDRWDYVLIDTAPSVAAGDAIDLASRADASLLVIQAGREERGLVARLAGQFAEARGELLGVVLNRPRQAVGGYFRRNYEVMSSYAPEDEHEDDED
ncbi:MAG: hypothetical protein MK101_07020 [Phycisphaerales bacterium]|nr:hypothetical protein [Phycisphaerales bacterium]